MWADFRETNKKRSCTREMPTVRQRVPTCASNRARKGQSPQNSESSGRGLSPLPEGPGQARHPRVGQEPQEWTPFSFILGAPACAPHWRGPREATGRESPGAQSRVEKSGGECGGIHSISTIIQSIKRQWAQEEEEQRVRRTRTNGSGQPSKTNHLKRRPSFLCSPTTPLLSITATGSPPLSPAMVSALLPPLVTYPPSGHPHTVPGAKAGQLWLTSHGSLPFLYLESTGGARFSFLFFPH